MWNLAWLTCCRMSSLLLFWKVKLCYVITQSLWIYSGSHRQRIHLGGPCILGWNTSVHWCTMKSVAFSSEISHIATRDDKNPRCTLPQSSYLTCIDQIDCRGSVDSQVEEIYLVGVTSCASMSSLVACLGASLWFATGPTMRPLFFWACTKNLTCFFSGRKPCQRTSLLHRPSSRRTRYQGFHWKKESWSSFYTR